MAENKRTEGLLHLRRIIPLTAVEAEEALRNATKRQASENEINKIVEAVTGGVQPESEAPNA